MKNKKIAIFLVFTLLCTILAGCTSNDDAEKQASYSFELHFYQDEYEEEYSHYEKELIFEEDSSEICITGQTTSGTIDVTVVNKSSEDTKHEYIIDGVLDEIIPLDETVLDEWFVYIDCHEDTEGYIEVNVK